MAKVLQPTLSGGELAPGLHGRVDIARYLLSLATCRNFETKQTGGAVKRPGFRFCGEVRTDFGEEFEGDEDPQYRIIPFIVSEDVAYILELGHEYFRVWYNCALVNLGENGDIDEYTMSTPWGHLDLSKLRYTQSADVMYFTHPDYPTMELRRYSATSFSLDRYQHYNGPFRPINGNKSLRVLASAATGSVTITANGDLFTEDMVEALFYMEEQELRNVKPWEPAARDIAVGEYRRSDGKVYRCTDVPVPPGPSDYYITGSSRPTHDSGRAWDGSGDTRDDGVNDYVVGVEWEYVHSTYGVLRITGYVSGTEVTADVLSRLPDSCVGTEPVPVATYTFTGDGTTKVFSITGAVATSDEDYQVYINNIGVPP